MCTVTGQTYEDTDYNTAFYKDALKKKQWTRICSKTLIIPCCNSFLAVKMLLSKSKILLSELAVNSHVIFDCFPQSHLI